MAKAVTGVRITRYRVDDNTHYEFRGLSPSIYTVTVDSENLWTCSCKSAKFRNLCYHILTIKTETERNAVLKRLVKVPVTLVEQRDFNRYKAMDRFIAEAIYQGPREFITIGKFVYLGRERRRGWECENRTHIRLAGTVLEGIWDKYGAKTPRFRLIDCLFLKGIDQRLSPLAYRKDLLDSVANVWLPEGVEKAPYFYGEEKKELMAQYGCCILKDINSTYDRQNQSPRAWMEVRHGEVGKNSDEDLR